MLKFIQNGREGSGCPTNGARQFRSVLTILLVLTVAWHSKLGVEVVVEDYIPGKGTKTTLLLLSAFVHVAATVAAVFAVLLLALQ